MLTRNPLILDRDPKYMLQIMEFLTGFCSFFLQSRLQRIMSHCANVFFMLGRKVDKVWKLFFRIAYSCESFVTLPAFLMFTLFFQLLNLTCSKNASWAISGNKTPSCKIVPTHILYLYLVAQAYFHGLVYFLLGEVLLGLV
jgi:hypothetical protein